MAKKLHQRQVRATSNSLDGLIVQAFFDLDADPYMEKEKINATEIASMINLDGNRYPASVIGKRLTALGFARKKSTDGCSRYYVIDNATRANLQRQFIPDDIDDTESTDTSDSTDSNSGTGNLPSQFDRIRDLNDLLRVQSYTMLDLESLYNKQGDVAELAQTLLSRGESSTPYPMAP